MKVLCQVACSGLLPLMLLPAAWAADGVLRGSLPVAAPQSVDPPGLQITRLPSGSLLKRMPGQQLVGESIVAPAVASAVGVAGLARGESVQQIGAAQMKLPSSPPVASEAAPQFEFSTRQIGNARLRELPAMRAAPPAALKASTALPAGVQIVDLPAGQPVPAHPAPGTLYRRLQD